MKVTPPLTHSRCCTITLCLLLVVVQIKSFSRNHVLDHRRALAVAAKQTTQRRPIVSSSPQRSNSDEEDKSSSTSLFKVGVVNSDTLPKQQQQRRAFLSSSLASTATTSLLLLTSNPCSVSAYSYVKSDVLVLGSDDIMLPKAHGTTDMPVQENLRFGVSII